MPIRILLIFNFILYKFLYISSAIPLILESPEKLIDLKLLLHGQIKLIVTQSIDAFNSFCIKLDFIDEEVKYF